MLLRTLALFILVSGPTRYVFVCGEYTEFVDLSYSVGNSTIFYPGSKGYTLNRDQEGWKDDGKFWYSSFSFCMGEHGGTHLDAPYHFHQDGWTVDQIPESRLINVPAVVVNVEPELQKLKTEEAGNFKLAVEHILMFERTNGRIPHGAVVLIYTGWSKYWPDRNSYLGIENGTDGTPVLRFPGISEPAIKWLSEERQIVGVGMDTPSVDQGSDSHYPVHVYAASRQMYNLENLANLHLLAKKDLTDLRLFVLPLKIVGGTGAPARILAAVHPVPKQV